VFAQGREWTHEYSLVWQLLDYPEHQGVQRLVKDLNHLYRATPALYARDSEPDGFEWIDASDSEQSVVTYLRRDMEGGLAVVACNFTPVPRHAYRVGVPVGGTFDERLNTDDAAYGGSGVANGAVEAEEITWHGRPYSLSLTLPPLGTVVLVPR
jgi:1,4-alpha-glucan branching enzyme